MKVSRNHKYICENLRNKFWWNKFVSKRYMSSMLQQTHMIKDLVCQAWHTEFPIYNITAIFLKYKIHPIKNYMWGRMQKFWV